MIEATAIRVSAKSSRISLGRSRRSAAMFRAEATTPPPSSRNAPVMWRNRSQSYLLKAAEPKARGGYLQSARGRNRPSPTSVDRDDRRRQLDARPRGGAFARRPRGGRRARRGRLLRLPLRRAGGRARAACDARDAGRGDDRPSADAAG